MSRTRRQYYAGLDGKMFTPRTKVKAEKLLDRSLREMQDYYEERANRKARYDYSYYHRANALEKERKLNKEFHGHYLTNKEYIKMRQDQELADDRETLKKRRLDRVRSLKKRWREAPNIARWILNDNAKKARAERAFKNASEIAVGEVNKSLWNEAKNKLAFNDFVKSFSGFGDYYPDEAYEDPDWGNYDDPYHQVREKYPNLPKGYEEVAKLHAKRHV